MNPCPTPLRSTPLSLPSELELVRDQIAVSRRLLDSLEDALPPYAVIRPPSREMVEELARLGCRVLEAAAAFSGHYRALRPSTRSAERPTEPPPVSHVRTAAGDDQA